MIFNKNMLIATAVALVASNGAVMAQSSAAPAASGATAATPVAAEPVYAVPNAKIAWKESYPSGASKPVPKAEWLALVKEDPLLKVSPNVLTVGKSYACALFSDLPPTSHCKLQMVSFKMLIPLARTPTVTGPGMAVSSLLTLSTVPTRLSGEP